MQNLSKVLLVGVIALMAYVVVNDVQANDVAEAVGDVSNRAQDFVGDVDFEGDTEFRSIDDEPADPDQLTDFDGNTFTLDSDSREPSAPEILFAIDPDSETDAPVEAPSAITRPGAQAGTSQEAPAAE